MQEFMNKPIGNSFFIPKLMQKIIGNWIHIKNYTGIIEYLIEYMEGLNGNKLLET